MDDKTLKERRKLCDVKLVIFRYLTNMIAITTCSKSDVVVNSPLRYELMCGKIC